MNVHHKAHTKWPLLLLSILALSLFLVACGNSGGTTSTGSTTSSPTPTGSTYTGNGYTLSYPSDWTYTTQGPVVVFKNTTDSTATLSIAVTPATPLTSQDQLFTVAESGLKTNANYQQDTTNLPSTSIGGDTWQETGGTYDQNGQHTKGVVLADQHPTSTGSVFVITLTSKADSYDQVLSTGFKPILDSFKFS